MISFPDRLNALDYTVPVPVHIAKPLSARLSKFEILSWRPIAGRFGITADQTIRLQTRKDRVDIALADCQTLDPLENLDHFVAMTPPMLQKIQHNNIEQPLAQLSLPVVEIQFSPTFFGTEQRSQYTIL